MTGRRSSRAASTSTSTTSLVASSRRWAAIEPLEATGTSPSGRPITSSGTASSAAAVRPDGSNRSRCGRVWVGWAGLGGVALGNGGGVSGDVSKEDAMTLEHGTSPVDVPDGEYGEYGRS